MSHLSLIVQKIPRFSISIKQIQMRVSKHSQIRTLIKEGRIKSIFSTIAYNNLHNRSAKLELRLKQLNYA